VGTGDLVTSPLSAVLFSVSLWQVGTLLAAGDELGGGWLWSGPW